MSLQCCLAQVRDNNAAEKGIKVALDANVSFWSLNSSSSILHRPACADWCDRARVQPKQGFSRGTFSGSEPFCLQLFAPLLATVGAGLKTRVLNEIRSAGIWWFVLLRSVGKVGQELLLFQHYFPVRHHLPPSSSIQFSSARRTFICFQRQN